MRSFDTWCGGLAAGLVMLVLLVAPWLFGAWEMWHFWPLAVLLFAAAACFGVRLMLCARLGTERLHLTHRGQRLLLAYLPFLLYALVRAAQADVFMDAERSFLLHLTPVLIAALIVFGFSDGQLRWLRGLLAVNLALLGVYGIANYYIGHNARVLWRPGFPQYQAEISRATGSYFCPDHFSGVMELAFGLALGLLLTRGPRRSAKALAVPLLVVGLWGVYLSRSRGGGLTLVVMALAALAWGVGQWPRPVRWALRCAGVGAGIAGIAALLLLGGHYLERFKSYPWRQLEQVDRYQMSAAALRGWRSAPVFGIGPGLHGSVWPHFAPSPDGDRATGRWPRFLNNEFHSYAAHNDWAQLLEEYGAAGALLFLVAIGAVAGALSAAWRRGSRRWQAAAPAGAASEPSVPWMLLGATLAGVAMAFHSLGDFNLQMPATTWLLAAIVAAPLAQITREPRHRRRR